MGANGRSRMGGRSSENPLDWVFSVGHRKGRPMITLDDERGCWLWNGHTHAGYGVMTYDSKLYPDIKVGRRSTDAPKQNGKTRGTWKAIMPHQFFYVRKYGNPPPGTELAHSCHRRRCCNPDHVRPKSKSENSLEKFLHPDQLDRETISSIEDALRADQPIHQVADEHAVPVYTVISILTKLKTGQSDLFWDGDLEEVPF